MVGGSCVHVVEVVHLAKGMVQRRVHLELAAWVVVVGEEYAVLCPHDRAACFEAR